MAEQKTLRDSTADDAIAPLREEYEEQQVLFRAQPAIVQRFLEGQARSLADSILQRLPQVRFMLPDRIVMDPSPEHKAQAVAVAPESREQFAGGLLDRLTRSDIGDIVRQRLNELAESPDAALAAAAQVLRHATAMHMVYAMLPAGRPVHYVPADGEEISTIPVGDGTQSAVTASTDAIAEEEERPSEREELLAPYVPYARRFFLPQWVMFDEDGRLLVNSTGEAEADLASMQRFLSVLHAAVALAPHMVADDEYQRKRHGMLGQLVNQGRALARYETNEIIRVIKQRAAAQDLNRGLSLSLPYFDDQSLQMRTYDFVIIPAGRIMFVPAFVVRASREEQAKVAQDTRISASTRKHLLIELKNLEQSFDAAHPLRS